MIKVLQIGPSETVGGIEIQVHNWWKHLDRSVIQFDFLVYGKKEIIFEKEYVDGGAKIIHIPSRNENLRKHCALLKSIVVSNNYDYIHYHIMSFSAFEPIYIVGKTKSNTKMIVHSHSIVNKNTYTKKTKALDMIGRLITQNCNYFELACGHEAGETMFRNNNFEVLENGIDTFKYKFSEKAREEIRFLYGINKNIKIIGHVGRYNRQKNIQYLLKLFKKISDVEDNLKLLLVGNAAEHVEVKQLIQLLAIEDKVILAGVVDHVEKYYCAMDILFLPSLYEGLCVSLIEAQACGLKCIVSEWVSKENDITGDMEFVSIKDEDNVMIRIKELLRCSSNRNLQINKAYSIVNSSEKLMRFYVEHSNKK